MRAEQIDYRPLERPAEALHLDAAAREVPQRLKHDLAGAMIGDLAAAVGAQHRNSVLNGGCRRPLPQRVHRRMLHQPDLILGIFGPAKREIAHRPQGRPVVDPAELPDADFFDDLAHSTMTTLGWSQRSW